MLWPRAQRQDDLIVSDTFLEGERLFVRPPCFSDLEPWIEARGRNQAYLTEYEPRWAEEALTPSFFMRRLKRQKRDWEERRGYSFLIFKKDAGGLIGGINLNNVIWGAARHAQIGYWLDEAYQGQGFMTDAARLVIRFAFDEIDLKRINASCLPGNERSARLLARLGFEEEGFARAYLQINGIWQDHRLFGLNQA